MYNPFVIDVKLLNKYYVLLSEAVIPDFIQKSLLEKTENQKYQIHNRISGLLFTGRFILFFSLMGFVSLYLFFEILASSSNPNPGLLIFSGIASFLAISCILIVYISSDHDSFTEKCVRDLEKYEEYLEMKWVDISHLNQEQLSARAEKILVDIAKMKLALEKEVKESTNAFKSIQENDQMMGNILMERFDFFKSVGLINPDETYKKYFEKAQAEIRVAIHQAVMS